jgi:hypothetical protein
VTLETRGQKALQVLKVIQATLAQKVPQDHKDLRETPGTLV